MHHAVKIVFVVYLGGFKKTPGGGGGGEGGLVYF